MKIKFKKLNDKAKTPKYNYKFDSGFDIYPIEYKMIRPQSTAIVSTGLSFEIPEGYELQIRPRSSISKQSRIRVANSPATIDSGYRGELILILDNISPYKYFETDINQAIAQGVICPVIKAEFEESDDLSESDRGDKGFGSTDNK